MDRGRLPLLSQNLFLSGTFRTAADVTAAAALQANPDDASGAKQFSEGDFVRARGLQARPDLNGTVGKLVCFFPDKNRWAVQFDKLGKAKPNLITPDNLVPCVQVCNVLDFASSEPQFATLRELQWAGRKLRLFGVQGYSSTTGGDEIFYGVQSFRPGVVLMESFDVTEAVTISYGDVLPYREIFPSAGLERALELVASSEFRKAWSAEAVAVLSALHVGAEIRVCHRLHGLSFDRLMRRLTLTELKNILIQATELVGQSLEAIRARRAESEGGAPVTLSDLPQNLICPFFPELGLERQQLMAHCARCAAEQGHDVAIVVGVEHLAGIVQQFDEVLDANLSGKSYQAVVNHHNELLTEVESNEAGSAAWNEEIEKRALVAAFLRSTLTFPPEAVLPPADQLEPEVTAQVRKTYPRFKEAFSGRVLQALDGQDLSAYLARPRPHCLAKLHELCKAS